MSERNQSFAEFLRKYFEFLCEMVIAEEIAGIFIKQRRKFEIEISGNHWNRPIRVFQTNYVKSRFYCITSASLMPSVAADPPVHRSSHCSAPLLVPAIIVRALEFSIINRHTGSLKGQFVDKWYCACRRLAMQSTYFTRGRSVYTRVMLTLVAFTLRLVTYYYYFTWVWLD